MQRMRNTRFCTFSIIQLYIYFRNKLQLGQSSQIHSPDKSMSAIEKGICITHPHYLQRRAYILLSNWVLISILHLKQIMVSTLSAELKRNVENAL